MSNKKVIKEMFDEQFNKDNNYQKILSKVEGVSDMKNRILKITLVPICCVIVACGIALTRPNENNNSIIKVAENDNQEIYINIDVAEKSKSNPRGDMDIKMQENSLEEFGFLNDIKTPNDLDVSSSYLIYTKNDKESEEYNILHDYVVHYQKHETNELLESVAVSKSITIAFSKDFKPLRDYHIDTANLKKSKINNTELTIQNKNEMYLAQFTYNNLIFDIETKGITEKELVTLLTSIIK
jgi:hypothetical protein